jgi:hypothetical protein
VVGGETVDEEAPGDGQQFDDLGVGDGVDHVGTCREDAYLSEPIRLLSDGGTRDSSDHHR